MKDISLSVLSGSMILVPPHLPVQADDPGTAEGARGRRFPREDMATAQIMGALAVLAVSLDALAQAQSMSPGALQDRLESALQDAGFDIITVTLVGTGQDLRLRLDIRESEDQADWTVDTTESAPLLAAEIRADNIGSGRSSATAPEKAAPNLPMVVAVPVAQNPPAQDNGDDADLSAAPALVDGSGPANTSGSHVSAAQLQGLADGILTALSALQLRIETQILAETLPLVGDGLATASQAGQAALRATQTLGEVLSDALAALATGTGQSAAAVEAALESALFSAGFAGSAITISFSGSTVRLGVATEKAGSYLQELATDLALAGLDAVGAGTSTVETLFTYDLGFRSSGSTARLDTSSAAEVTLDFVIDDLSLAPELSVAGQTFAVADAGTRFGGSIGLDIQAATSTIAATQVAGATLSARLDGAADVRLGVAVADKGAFTPPITAELAVDWDFNDAPMSPTGSNATFGERPSVSFDTVTLDLAEFMEGFIGPLVEQVDALMEPLRPIINVMTTSIKALENFPGLGNLLDVTGGPNGDPDGKVNLLDLLVVVSPNANLDGFLKIVSVAEKVALWSEFLTSTEFASTGLSLGAFDIGTADIRAPGFDLTTALGIFRGLDDSLDTVVSGLSGAGWSTTLPGTGMTGRAILQDILNDDVFNLPVLDTPAEWMNLFLGKAANLVTIDLPEVVIGTDTTTPPGGTLNSEVLFRIPIFPLINVIGTYAFQARFNLDFGFDTRGLLDPTKNAIDGLYVIDAANEAEILLRALVGLGVSFDAAVLEATVEGNVQGDIELDLRNSLGSTPGRVYYDEFIAAFTANPFTIFDASGSITAGVSAWVDSIFGEVWRWDSPRVTLGDFGFDNLGTPNLNLANKSGATLTLNTGDRAVNRNIVTPNFDGPENVALSQTPGGQLLVSINGYTQEFRGISTVVGGGGIADDALSIAAGLAVAGRLSGGDGDDVLQGGDLNDTLRGNDGDDVLLDDLGADQLFGGDGNDHLVGGMGADILNGGLGDDTVSYRDSDGAVLIDLTVTLQQRGHAAADQLTSIENIEGSAFDDTITGAAELGLFIGGDGDDSLISGSGVQVLLGNDGNDLLEGGIADTLVGGEGDDIYIVRHTSTYINENELGEIAAGSDSGHDWIQAWASVNLAGMDDHVERITLYGTAESAVANSLDNRIEGNDLDNLLSGLDGNDTLTGIAGDDTLYGGVGDDRVFGGNDHDDLHGGEGDDSLTGGGGNDTLRGGAGNDLMLGGSGGDYYTATTGDVVIELANQGVDFVHATETFVLGAGQQVEILSQMGLDGRAWGGPWVFPALRGEGYYELVRLFGTRSPDTTGNLTGNALDQVLIADIADIEQPNSRNILEGLLGADTIVGDFRLDVAAYTQSRAAVFIDLFQPVQSGGHAEGDMLYGINNLIGSDFNDTLLGQYDPALPFSTVIDNEFFGGGGDDSLEGYLGHDTLHGDDGDDSLFGGSMDDQMFGGAGRDLLEDLEGDDTFDGGAAIDTMNGGSGDNLYHVTTGDRITDTGGDDTVIAHEDYFLANGREIERLEAQAGVGGLILYGNSFGQTIVGHSGDDTIHGGAGADVIDGRGGVDTASYLLSNAGVDVSLNRTFQLGGHAAADSLNRIENLRGSLFADMLTGSATAYGDRRDDNLHQGEAGNDRIEDVVGRNTLDGGAGDDTLIGSGEGTGIAAAGSLLIGGLGNDSLDGGTSTATGGDTMAGGLGDDTYRITSLGDVVDENHMGDIPAGQSGGHDTLIVDIASIKMNTGTLLDIEDAILGTGSHVTGNTLANVLTGNELGNRLVGLNGNDTLNGEGGNDTLTGGNGDDLLNGGRGNDLMTGGAGNDLYLVSSTGDIVVELASGGEDTVRASVTVQLAANVETLELTGTGGIGGTGNALANMIAGNGAANVLDGRLGADTLTGGLGADTFRFTTAFGVGNVDTITDFVAGTDRIEIEAGLIGALGPGALASANFRASSTGLAQTPQHRILYDTTTGELFFDADGSDSGERILFAVLSAGPGLTHNDFGVI